MKFIIPVKEISGKDIIRAGGKAHALASGIAERVPSSIGHFNSLCGLKQPGHQEKKGSHARTIEINNFRKLLNETRGFDFDIMCETKDKEKSALQAAESLRKKKASLTDLVSKTGLAGTRFFF